MDRSNRPNTNEILDIVSKERALSPEQTLRNIQALISEAGITRLAHLTHLDTLEIPVYTAIRPLSKSLATAQGKGLSHLQAQCSAYIEAIEYYYAETIPTHLMASAQDIPSSQRCFESLPPGLTQAQGDQSIAWTIYKDYSTHHAFYVPTHFTSFDLTQPHAENGWFNKTTAGLASGNTLEEALTYGLYELIERQNRKFFHQLSNEHKKNRMLNLTTLPESAALSLIQHIHTQKTQCLIFHLPSYFELPTFYCLLRNTHPLKGIGHYEGYGAHWDAEVALCKAITEAAQSRLTYIAGSRDDMMPSDYTHPQDDILNWSAKQSFDQIPSYSGLSTQQQLQRLHQQLSIHHFTQHLYLELTPKHSPLKVTHSIVPGLVL